MTEFVKGQRVRYVGDVTPGREGEEGVVVVQTSPGNVDVCWDNKKFHDVSDFWGVFPSSITLIEEIFKYDPNQTGDTDEDV